MIPHHHHISSLITKPVNLIDTNQIKEEIMQTGANTYLLQDYSKAETALNDGDSAPQSMSLLDFMRIYKIGQIPIIDFVFGYIILYLLNVVYGRQNYKLILIGTIPLVILLNLLFNRAVKPTFGLALAVGISAALMTSIELTRPKHE